jgi:hypothetical protein
VILDKRFMAIAERAIHEHGALQDEWEMAMLLAFAWGMQPAVLLEIGSYTGGSLYAWRAVLPECHVLSCTLGDTANFHGYGASMIFGNSTSRDIQEKIWSVTRGEVDFVFVDGGHDEATAYSDVEFALKLTAEKRGAVGVHDINLFLRYPDLTGPRVAWNYWRDRYPSIEVSNDTAQDPGFGILWNR